MQNEPPLTMHLCPLSAKAATVADARQFSVIKAKKMSETTNFQQFEKMHEEQLPVPKHKLHGWTHFAGLYAAEHVAATEFVIGATFVALGARTMDIILGLLIGNI